MEILSYPWQLCGLIIKDFTVSSVLWSLVFDRPLTNYLVQTWVCECMHKCLCMYVYMFWTWKYLQPWWSLKVMNCARSILQIHAVQAQLGSHCCSVLFLSLIFPYCTSHSCYSTPSPFTQIQKNISVLRIPGADFRTYSTVIELYLFQTT